MTVAAPQKSLRDPQVRNHCSVKTGTGHVPAIKSSKAENSVGPSALDLRSSALNLLALTRCPQT